MRYRIRSGAEAMSHWCNGCVYLSWLSYHLLAAKARVTGSRVVPTAGLRGPNREKGLPPGVILLSKWPVDGAID